MNNLKNKIILITGGGSGLGAATGMNLAKEGATVVLGDVQKEKAERVAQEIKKKGRKAESLFLDVSDDNSCKKARNYLLDTYKGLDILINNAGIDITLPFEKLDMEEFDMIMNVNLRGAVCLSKLFFIEIAKRHGCIVNIASTASSRAWPNATAYHASKWGLIGFSRALYTEAREKGVKVAAIIPGGMKTPHLLERFPDIDQSKLQEPENVARVVSFILCQPNSTIIPEIVVLPMLETSWP